MPTFAIMTIAVGGMVTSTIVLILSLVGAVKFRRDARRDRKAFARLGKDLPPISVLKPVHGNEARLKENIGAAELKLSAVDLAQINVVARELKVYGNRYDEKGLQMVGI